VILSFKEELKIAYSKKTLTSFRAKPNVTIPPMLFTSTSCSLSSSPIFYSAISITFSDIGVPGGEGV
jgi:hypothetical protein